MFEVTTSTALFGCSPRAGCDRSAYEAAVARRYSLAPAPPPAADTPDSAERPTVPERREPARSHEIIRGSTGSRVFALLQGLRPGAGNRSAPAAAPPRKKDSGQPKRKLPLSA